MIGRTFIEFIGIIITMVGILMMAIYPSPISLAGGVALILASIAILIRHYSVITDNASEFDSVD